MKLLRLQLEKFRNYPSLDLKFDPAEPITCIIGQNAQGKTNILEAIYLLALTKSFRANHSDDLILWDEDFCRVKGELQMDESARGADSAPGVEIHSRNGKNAPSQETLSLEAFYGRAPHPKKSLKKNNVKISSTEFVGNCQIVFFHPEDLNMLYLGPDLRRRYLDILNIQINRKYFHALKNYKKILQQRNALLKEIKRGFAQKNQLEVWDDQMVENGSIIALERAKTVKFLNAHLGELYSGIAEKEEKVDVKYVCASGEIADGAGHGEHEEIQKIYAQNLRAALPDDLRSEVTSIGPHRDDLQFLLNGRPLACHASRGEYRSLLLSLKLLELKFFRDATNEKPILLLDDVFSELDSDRQKMLLKSIAGHQTIITTTHSESMGYDREHRSLFKQVEIKEGKCLIL